MLAKQILMAKLPACETQLTYDIKELGGKLHVLRTSVQKTLS